MCVYICVDVSELRLDTKVSGIFSPALGPQVLKVKVNVIELTARHM